MALGRIKEVLSSLLLGNPPSPVQEVEEPQVQSMPPNHYPTVTSVVPRQDQHPEWGNIILNFCFTTAIGLLFRSIETQHQLPWYIHILSLAIILAFSSSLFGILFRSKFPTAAKVLEHMGLVSVTIAFFMVTAISLPPPYNYFAWLICALSLLSTFVFYLYPGSQSERPAEWNSPGAEFMWHLGLGSRPGETDCTYYMRTGFCGYGARCRFNHPRERSMVMGAARPGAGEYPERVGQRQRVCRYFLKTGTCKFGASCKLHHPRNGGGSMSPVSLNDYGYLLRPGEKECSYYVRTGECKFGVTCRFHHPQPFVGAGPLYGVSQISPAAPAYGGLRSSAGPSSSSQHIFPERPGQPKCKKKGVPLRPGATTCTFYAQHGVCKFDHPMGTQSCSPTASSLADMPVATLLPSSSSSELRQELISGASKDSLSIRIPSSENTPSASAGSLFSKTAPVPHSNVQLLGHS